MWAEKLPPEKPDRYLEKGFKLPDFNIDWESIGEGLKTGVEFLLIPLWLLKEIFSPSWQQASLEDHALRAQEKQINEQSTPSSTAQWKIEDVGQNPLRSAVLDTVIFAAELTQDGEELPDGSLVTSNEAFTSVIDPNGVNLGIFKPDQSLAAVLDLETTEIEMQMDQENIAFFTDLQGLIAQVKTEMSQDSAMEVEDLGGYG